MPGKPDPAEQAGRELQAQSIARAILDLLGGASEWVGTAYALKRALGITDKRFVGKAGMKTFAKEFAGGPENSAACPWKVRASARQCSRMRVCTVGDGVREFDNEASCPCVGRRRGPNRRLLRSLHADRIFGRGASYLARPSPDRRVVSSGAPPLPTCRMMPTPSLDSASMLPGASSAWSSFRTSRRRSVTFAKRLASTLPAAAVDRSHLRTRPSIARESAEGMLRAVTCKVGDEAKVVAG